jgi:hypothetical protein
MFVDRFMTTRCIIHAITVMFPLRSGCSS